MDGTFLVLRSDLVVFIPGAPLSVDSAHAFFDQLRQATEGSIRIVVLQAPVQVVDARDADPALVLLAEQLAARLAERYPMAASA